MSENTVKIWVGVVIRRENKILMGKRFGKWCFPGGHLTFGEKLEECAKREVEEETGVKIKNVRFSKLTNDIMPDKHYVSIFMEAEYTSGTPKILEPDKCDEWKWFDQNSLPANVFIPVENYMKRDCKSPD